MVRICCPRSASLRLGVGAFAVVVALSAAGCATRNLHPSYALRHNELFSAQSNARNPHDPITRGEESVRNIGAYYQSFIPQTGGGGGGPQGLVSPSTAGVRPLN